MNALTATELYTLMAQMQMLCHKDFAMMSNVVNERKNQALCHRLTVSHHWIRNLERGLGKCCFFFFNMLGTTIYHFIEQKSLLMKQMVRYLRVFQLVSTV